jgi:phosphatidylserine/phosphatidylglycerophosphate/cardiolipin synthase-like enzyme
MLCCCQSRVIQSASSTGIPETVSNRFTTRWKLKRPLGLAAGATIYDALHAPCQLLEHLVLRHSDPANLEVEPTTMSSTCQGNVITYKDDVVDSGSIPLPNFTLTLYTSPGNFKVGDPATTDKNGAFTLNYSESSKFESGGLSSPGGSQSPRNLRLVIRDAVGRIVLDNVIADVSTSSLNLASYTTLKYAEAQGFLVTLGTGATGPSGTNGTIPGWGLAQGCSVKLLIDNEQFQTAAELMTDARQSIYMSQLFFPVPTYNADATQETPQLIFNFHDPVPDAAQPRAAGVGDSRPERLLLQAAAANVDVRVLLSEFGIGDPLGIGVLRLLLEVILFFPALISKFFSSGNLLFTGYSQAGGLKKYFTDAGASSIEVYPFALPVVSEGVMHAKLMVVDAQRVLSMGSPFQQNYIDTHAHSIDAPVRGDLGTYPNHDVGFIAKGPVINTVYDTLKLLWNNVAADKDKIPDTPPTPPGSGPSTIPDNDWDDVCNLQIVRTLTGDKVFPTLPNGEKGILEAYLRAINMAQHLIYFENQWLINQAIVDAIVSAMNHNPKLQTIMLLNIKPESLAQFYPFRQRRQIHHIQEKTNPSQFGVFTRWSHQVAQPQAQPPQPRPQLLPIYTHAKVGIVDDTWCTVGSANLDNYSMYSAIEVNAIMLNGVDGAPASKLPDILRRRLWAEHLGYIDSTGQPDMNAADLVMPSDPTKQDWLTLWNNHAKGTLSQLINDPTQPLTANGVAHILQWPTDNTTHKYPRDYIETLKIQSYQVVPLKGTRAFNFKSGAWKDTTYPMDY